MRNLLSNVGNMERWALRLCVAVAVCFASAAAACFAQFQEEQTAQGKSGAVVTSRWDVGMIVTAEGGGVQRIVGTTTVPMDWPEQRVRRMKEDLSPGVFVDYQDTEGVARQMVVKIPLLNAGQQAKAIVTFEKIGRAHV